MAGKGKGKKKEKEPKDKFTDMEEEKLIEFIQKTKEQIKEVKVKRNFVQQERDMINEFYEISKLEEKKLRDACEKEEIVMDHLQQEHQNNINAFINKYRHLEYDHEIFINEKLPNKSQEALDKEEQIRKHREDIYMQKKQDLKDDIKLNTIKHRDQIESKKANLQNNYDDKKRQLEERLKNIIKRYKQKMKQLAEDLELRLKVEIHELEERKNLHINNLNRTFDQKMKDWKTENINQIKESIKIIKQYIGVLKDYENENKKLQYEKYEYNGQKMDNDFFEEYMSTSLDELEFDDAVAKDKRTYCEHTIENLKEDQIIANTFIAEDPVKPRSIKIIVFILNVMLYFVVNGLFFSEEVISELYNVDEESENFFSFLPRSITRLIYTTIVSLIIGYITGFFFLEEKKVVGIFKRDKDNRVILKESIDKIRSIR